MRSRVTRAVTAAAVSVPLAGGLLLAAAPAASAAVSQPGNGTVFADATTIAVRADYPRGTSSLSLTSPGGPAVTVASGGSQFGGAGTLTYALDTSCWTYPSSSCSGRKPAPNGTWTLTQSGSATDTVRFVLRIPPVAPGGVTAEALDRRSVRVSWRRGDEPDLRGYTVLEGSEIVRELGTDACSGTTCTTTLTYPTEGTGEHTYAVRSERSDGAGGTLTSPASGTASATLAAPPPPEPEPQPSSGGSTGGGTGGETGGGTGGTGGGTGGTGGETGGGTGGTGTGGATGGTGGGTGSTPPVTGGGGTGSAAETVAAQRKAFALSFKAFGPKLGIPKLPPLPQAQAPSVAPLPDGTFEPTLGFSDQVLRERVETQGSSTGLTGAVGRALDSEQLAQSTAGALLLLLCGAHLRRWLGSAPQD